MALVRKLPVTSSLYLDVIRFLAAVMVCCGHLTQPYFSTGWRDHTALAVNAVGIFFVLSGFVIRYTSRLKYHRIGEYWVDRSARIYSVVLPAVLFTVLADALSYRAAPGYYLGNWAANIDHPALRLFANLTFTSQVWSHSFALFSNGPFWSLSYECFYYVLYGCAFYLSGMRRAIALVAVAALAGPHILLLLPLWLLGCAVFDAYEWSRARPKLPLHLLLLAVGVAAFLLRNFAYSVLFAVKSAFARVLLAHQHQPVNLRWTLDYYSVGIPAAFLLLWSVLWIEAWKEPRRTALTRSIRLMAEGTFPLYLFHFPCFVLIAAIIPYDHGNALVKLAILLAVISGGILLARPSNVLKTRMRAWMQRRFLPKDALPQPRSIDAAS